MGKSPVNTGFGGNGSCDEEGLEGPSKYDTSSWRFKFSFHLTAHLLLLILTEEVEKMNKKMEEVREANIRVVSEDFLQDVSASMKGLQELFSAHILSPWGAEVKAEPSEVVAPRGKVGAALPKKSKGPGKEAGEVPAAQLPWSWPCSWPAARVCLCGASPPVPQSGLWNTSLPVSSAPFSMDTGWRCFGVGRAGAAHGPRGQSEGRPCTCRPSTISL